jgi:catechol 2,3-dioxygenase-like lactoylglutathione lyase family enzyme
MARRPPRKKGEKTREKPMLKPRKLVHFTIPVKDLDRSEKFYTEILGFQKVRRNAHMVFLRTGQDHFVLTHSEKPVDPNPGDEHEIHHAFLVDPADYDAALTFLKSKGIKVIKEEDRQKGTFQGRSAYFHDPDRNVIEIIDLQNDPMADIGA